MTLLWLGLAADGIHLWLRKMEISGLWNDVVICCGDAGFMYEFRWRCGCFYAGVDFLNV